MVLPFFRLSVIRKTNTIFQIGWRDLTRTPGSSRFQVPVRQIWAVTTGGHWMLFPFSSQFQRWNLIWQHTELKPRGAMMPTFIMTSSNWSIFRVTGLLCGEFTGNRWIPHTKTGDAELWCFLWSAPEQTVDQTMETPVIWDTIALIMTSL